MAQTERDMSLVQSLLADNTAGAISPQDLRDAIASLQGYGCLLLAGGGGGTTINSVGTSYVLVDVFDTITTQSSTANTSGVTCALSPTYALTFGSSGVYRVGFYASFSSSGNNKLVTFREHKNGVAQPVEVDRFIATGSDTGVVSFEDIEVESAGDVIDLRVKIDTGTTNLTFLAAGITAHRVG